MIQWNCLKRYVKSCRQKPHACVFSPVFSREKSSKCSTSYLKCIAHGKESDVSFLGQVASSHTSSASSSNQGGVNAEELVQKMKLLTSGVWGFSWRSISSSHYKFKEDFNWVSKETRQLIWFWFYYGLILAK